MDIISIGILGVESSPRTGFNMNQDNVVEKLGVHLGQIKFSSLTLVDNCTGAVKEKDKKIA